MFWGLTLKPGQQYIQTIDCSFHISMAAMESKSALAAGITQVKVQRGVSDYVLCTLVHGSLYQQSLDLTFGDGEEIVFSADGKATIYLTGYFLPNRLSDWGDQSQSFQDHQIQEESLPVDLEDPLSIDGAYAHEEIPRVGENYATDDEHGQLEIVDSNNSDDHVIITVKTESSAEQSQGRDDTEPALRQLTESRTPPTVECPKNTDVTYNASETPPNSVIKKGISIHPKPTDTRSNDSRGSAVRPIVNVPMPTAVYRSAQEEEDGPASECGTSIQREDDPRRWIDLNSSMAYDKEMQELSRAGPDQSDPHASRGNTTAVPRDGGSSDVRENSNVKVRKHSDARCNVCWKAFRTRGAFVSHKCRIKPLRCKFCGKKYASKKGLMGHENKHIGLKPYKCRHCEEAFTSSVFRTSHERFHTGKSIFHCKYCSKICIGTQNLQKHENLHQGIRPFKCNQCDKAYTIQRDLNRHTEEKHYSLAL